METTPATAGVSDESMFVALDVIAQLREETAEAFGALDAPEPDLGARHTPIS